LATQWEVLITRSKSERSNCSMARGKSGRKERYFRPEKGRPWMKLVTIGWEVMIGETLPRTCTRVKIGASG
jgi:hypothetical protein